MLKHSVKLRRFIYILGDVAACRRAACVLCAVKNETNLYCNVNLKLLTNLINSAFVGE